MWFKLLFYSNQSEIALLGTVSPSDAKIYFDAETVADLVLERQSYRSVLFQRARRFSTLCNGHPYLRELLPDDKLVFSLDDTVLILATFSDGGVWSEIAAILAADDFGKAITYTLPDDCFQHWDDHFFDPDQAIPVTVHPFDGDDSNTTVQQVLKSIISAMLEKYDSVENKCPNI